MFDPILTGNNFINWRFPLDQTDAEPKHCVTLLFALSRAWGRLNVCPLFVLIGQYVCPGSGCIQFKNALLAL